MNGYLIKHYQLVSNDFNGQTYQSDNNKNAFEVHFVHSTSPVNPDNPARVILGGHAEDH
ncbi:MAG: hypothetical protein ACLSH6_00250 [Limosilactobacillus pontis]